VKCVEEWPSQLEQILQKDGAGLLTSVIDSAGGEIMQQVTKILKDGGRLVCYGMYVLIIFGV
jgi:NADPH:quinone reductase-like Zn-dependent oxidoreductase